MSGTLAIFLHSDGYDRVYQAVNMIATASSAGDNCYLFLFYHALGAYVSGQWDDMELTPSAGSRGDPPDETTPWARTLKRSFELANVPSLYRVLDRAKQGEGDVTVYACSDSMRLLDLEPAVVKERVDGIVGLATMLDISETASRVLYL